MEKGTVACRETEAKTATHRLLELYVVKLGYSEVLGINGFTSIYP